MVTTSQTQIVPQGLEGYLGGKIVREQQIEGDEIGGLLKIDHHRDNQFYDSDQCDDSLAGIEEEPSNLVPEQGF